MSDNEFDIAVVGGGPGGYVAAIRAAQLNMKVALIEREHLGGICLNWGCIPTKSLLRSAEIFDFIKQADKYGLSVENASFDLDKIVERSRGVSNQLTMGIKYLMKKNKVTVFEGEASLESIGQLQVKDANGATDTVTAQNIIVATGARARQLPGLESDGKLVWTYKEAMVPDVMPDSLLVVGSGAIGMEFASFYNSLGASVTVAEILPQVLPAEDKEISGLAAKAFVKSGIDVRLETTVKSLSKQANSVVVDLEHKGETQELTVDRIISAVGVVPNVEGLGLGALGVALDENGFIQVDGYGRTSVGGIYAIGDVAGVPCLAHKASHEGTICVENIADTGEVHPLDKSRIPGCTYSNPQVASVGLTEQQANDQGLDVRVSIDFRRVSEPSALES